MKKIVIFGITQMAKVISEYIQTVGIDKVVAYTADKSFINNTTFNNLPLIPFEDIKESYPPDDFYILTILTPGSGTKHLAQKKYKAIKGKGYRFYTFIDPRAVVSPSAIIGDNCIVCNSAIIEPFVTLDDGVFIRSAAYISHDTKIGAFSYVAPRAAFSGDIKVGKHCFIGTNATIRDGIKIGNDSIVGAGAVLLKNLPAESIYKAAVGTILPIDRFKIKP